MLQIVLLATGLHNILFNRSEIANISLVLIPQRRDRDNLTFINNLKVNNFDLMKGPIPPADNIGFIEDSDLDTLDYPERDDYPDDNEDT